MATDIEVPNQPATQRLDFGLAIKSINLKNILSFGPDGIGLDNKGLELHPLNILIGANGSGKSNLIEAVSLLQAAPTDLNQPFLKARSTVRQWLWQGLKDVIATIEVKIDYYQLKQTSTLNYELSYTDLDGVLQITQEELSAPRYGADFNFLTHKGSLVEVRGMPFMEVQTVEREDYAHQAVVSKFKASPYEYPNEIEVLSRTLSSIRFYRGFNFAQGAASRWLNYPNEPADYLNEDASNLSAVYYRLLKDAATKARLLQYLQFFYPDAQDICVNDLGGFLQLVVKEQGREVATNRLSDGTLQWLALLAVLLSPNLPPLICLEEPEVGLHPDAIPLLGGLLREAGQRSQLIVTTHSTRLLDNFTPEDVVVCEKVDGATKLRRLNEAELVNWLDEYTLGEVWERNIVGGRK